MTDNKKHRPTLRLIIDSLVIFESLGLVIVAGAVLSLLHGGEPVSALIEAKLVANATTVAVLLYLSATITLAKTVLIKRKIAALCVAAAALSAAYFIEIRPIMNPPPLADSLPDNTTFFASADLLNIVRMAGVFGEAIGRDRVRSLLYPEVAAETAAPENNIFDAAAGWISREVLVAGGDITAQPPEYALLIGSRNKKRAEADFPALAALLFNTQPQGNPSAPPRKTTYIKDVFEGQSIYCERPARPERIISGSGSEPPVSAGQPVYCWTATDNAVLVSASKPYLKKLISRAKYSRDCGGACRNRFAALYEQRAAPNRVLYAYMDGRPVADAASNLLRNSQSARAAADFLRETAGAEYSFSFCGLEIRQTARLLFNNSGDGLSRHAARLASPAPISLSSRDKAAAVALFQDVLDSISANRNPPVVVKLQDSDYSVVSPGAGAGSAPLISFHFGDARLQIAPDTKQLELLKHTLNNARKDASARPDEQSAASASYLYGVDYSPLIFLAAAGLGPANDARKKSALEKDYFTNATNATILLLQAMRPGRVNITREINKVANRGIAGQGDYSVKHPGYADFSENSAQSAIELDWRQPFDAAGLRSYPFTAVSKASASHYALMRERAAHENFDSCLAEVVKTKRALDALASDENTVSSAGKYADGACHYITPGSMSPADCRGKVRARVEAACEPGSFSVKYLKGGKYDILAKARGDNSPRICATEKSIFPSAKKNYKDDKGWFCFH